MATKQFILELSRINSVRVQSEGEDADNKSNYTCIIPELDLKKNDIVQLDSSVINVRGADSQSLQFEGSYANNTNLIMDNIFMLEAGFYLNHNGLNDVHLPFVYTGEVTGDPKKQKFETDKTTGAGDDEKINLNYNMAKSQSYLSTSGNASDDFTARLAYVVADESNPSPEEGVMNCNPFVKLNGAKYAQIARQWSGWMRSYDNNRIGKTEPKLMTQEIPIQIPVGFTSPQGIADLITLNLQKTNPLKFDGNALEDLTSATGKYYKQDANQTPNPDVRQYVLNGYCYKSINANWTITGTDEFRNQAHLIYSSMATDEPYKWLYGTGILSMAETDPLANYQWFNPNTFGSQTAIDNLQLAYPCIIWNTFIGSNESDKNLTNYSLYSPSEEKIITGDQYSDDIITLSQLTGDYEIYNDVYRNVYTGDVGAYLIKQDNLYTIIKNDVVTITDDQGLQVKPALFVDDTDPNFTNLIAWNKYNILGGTWNRTTEQLVKKFNDVDEWHDGLLFSPSNATETGDIEPINNPFEGNGFIAIFTALVGTLGDYYTYNWMTDTNIVEGEKYTLSFTTTGQGAFTPPYIHPIIVADRSAVFGMNAMNITTDGDHTQTFTATASYNGSNAIMIGFRKQSPAGMVVKVSNISFLRDDTETDETYNVRDLNSISDSQIDLTNFENNKLYSLQQNASIGTFDLTLTGNTIPSQGGYTGVDFNKNYKVLVRGLIASYNGTAFVASNLLNGHDPNVCILYNNDDADYTYFIFQGYSFTDRWSIWRLSKYNGGIPVSGDVLGSIQSVGFNLKLGTRNGQQYYDFSQSNPWENRSAPNVIFSSGNDWTNVNPGNYASLRFFDTPGNAGGNIGYYDGYWANPLNLPQRVYYRYNPQGDTSATSGTAYYPPSDPAPYWQRQWSFDINTGTNGTFTQIYTDGSSATYEPSGALSATYPSVTFTSHVADPLPLIDTDKQYFASVVVDTITYYLGANNNGNGDDTDKEGQRGRLIYSTDGGASYLTGTWDWNGSDHIDLSVGLALYYQGSAPSLTNVFDYAVSQNISDAGSIFSVPTDGKMYGSGYGAFGSTTFSQSVASALYLGAGLTNTDYRTTLNIVEGYCYDNQGDDWANNNGLKWSFDEFSGKLSITRVSDNVKLSEYSKQGGANSIIKWGWILSRTDKNVNYDTEQSFFNPQTNIALQTIDRTPSQVEHVTLITIQNGLYDARDLNGNSAGGGTLKIENTPNAYLDKTIAKIPKSTLLMTNIKFTLDNIKRIEKLFRYTETYDGNETIRANIINDINNYYVDMDLNWTETDTLSTNSRNTSENTSGNKGVVMPYYYHYGQMGVDDSNEGGSEKNEGVIYPRKKSNGNEQRIRIFTRWEDDPYTRTIYTNRVDYEYTFCSSYTQEKLENDQAELYKYISDNNIGVIPMPMRDETGFCCCFEVYQDYTNEELYTQQSLQFFGWSPSEFDHNYIIPLNADAPAIKDSDYNFTGRQEDQMNFINIGATNPTFSYNDNLNKFEISNFHTNLQFNKESGTTIQEQQPYYEVRKEDVNFVDFMKNENLFDSGRIIDGIADAQAGIYINNLYFQLSKNELITDVNDTNIVEANPKNYYGSALWRMGFSYYQFKPLNFYDKMFNNRFNNLFYNSLRKDFRKYGCRPFTTNALVNIGSAQALNIFGQNTGRQNTENPNKGTAIYGLGYNNNQSASVQAISDKLVAKSLTINMKSPFFRIVTPDLPLDTLIYTAQGQRLNSVGTAILNYSSANMFFYSYASSYQATITRDTTINSISVLFVDDTGNLVQGLDDRSSVTLKVIRNIDLDNEKDPVVEELQDIEDEMKELNKKEEIENTNLELERAGESVGLGVGVGTGNREDIETNEDIGDTRMVGFSPRTRRRRRIPLRLRETTEEEAQSIRPISQQANRFIDSMILSIIQNGLNLTTITQQAKPRDYDDISNIFSRGVIEYYINNLPFINRMIDGLSREGINFLRNNRELTNFLEQNNNFTLSPDGELITDAGNSNLAYTINKNGAEVILNKINELMQGIDLRTNDKGEIRITPQQERDIASKLKPTIRNLLDVGGTITPPRPREAEAVPAGKRRGIGGIRPTNYDVPQKALLKDLIGNRMSDFIKNLGIDLKYKDDESIPLSERRSPLEKQLFQKRNLTLYQKIKYALDRNRGRDFRNAMGELMDYIRNAGVKRINNFNVLKYFIGERNMSTEGGRPLFSAGRDTIVKNDNFLYEGEAVPPALVSSIASAVTGGAERNVMTGAVYTESSTPRRSAEPDPDPVAPKPFDTSESKSKSKEEKED